MKLCVHVQGSYFNLTQEWLVRHKFPPGPIHLTRTHLPTLPIYYSVGTFKVSVCSTCAPLHDRLIYGVIDHAYLALSLVWA